MARQHGGTRLKIVRAAFRLFRERAYDEVTMEEVAREAGVSKGALFYYFPGKYELAKAAVEYAFHRFLEELRGSVEGKSGLEALESLISTALELEAENPKIVRFFLEVYEVSARRGEEGFWDNLYMEAIEFIEGVLRAAGLPEPRKRAVMLTALLDGLAWHYILSRGKVFRLDEVKPLVVDMITGGRPRKSVNVASSGEC